MRARPRPASLRPTRPCRLLLVALACALFAACAEPARPEPRNLVLILVDTLRRDHVGVYGAERPTPNIDALAARGQVFRKVLASFHQTSMSMGALFTGRTPSIESGDPRETLPWNSSTWCGMARFATPDGADTCLPRSLVTLPERLRAAGFWTIGVVSNQFLYEPSGFGRGFEDWTEIYERTATTGVASRHGVAKPHESRTWPHVNRAAFAALDKVQRNQFYSPSNPGWNRDSFWYYDGNPRECVAGYFYFVGEKAFNSSPSFYPNASTFWEQQPIFAMKTTDKAYYPLLWTDINRKYQNSWLRPGDPDPLTRGVNHYDTRGAAPSGANEGYIDGHVEWVRALKFVRTPKMNYSSLQIFFYAWK